MKRYVAAVLFLLAVIAPSVSSRAADPYRAFKDVRFTMDDGVRLAADVYLPPSGKGPFPCLVELTPYRKELRATEGASFLPAQGFALIEVDARGTGGSEGEYDYVFSLREQRDGAEMVDLAPTLNAGHGAPALAGWAGRVCTNKVGMFGGSYSGIIQYLVASLPKGLAPKHLVAIAPQRAYGDLYRDIVYQGGMVIGSFGAIWSGGTTAYYSAPPLDAASSSVADGAWADHLTKNDPMLLNYIQNPLIDAKIALDNTKGSIGRQRLYLDSSILPRISNLHVPVLHLAGWFDAFTRGQMLTFETALRQERAHPGAHGPNFLIVGPWNHSNTHFITPASTSVSGPPDMDKGSLQTVLADWYRYWLASGPRPAWMDGPLCITTR
jgi:putative CocE/NonD family hydrolase